MSIKDIKIGQNVPEYVNAVIENPRGTRTKYEYEEKADALRLDRILFSAVFFPNDYGFIPETRAEDGDHLDVLVIVSEPLVPGSFLPVRPIGVLDMEDENGRDWKIISVAEKDAAMRHINQLEDLTDHKRNEIRHFFEVYKHLEGKKVIVNGWLGKEDAFKEINDAVARYSGELRKV